MLLFYFLLSFEKSRANLNRNLKKNCFIIVVELIFFFVVIVDCWRNSTGVEKTRSRYSICNKTLENYFLDYVVMGMAWKKETPNALLYVVYIYWFFSSVMFVLSNRLDVIFRHVNLNRSLFSVQNVFKKCISIVCCCAKSTCGCWSFVNLLRRWCNGINIWDSPSSWRRWISFIFSWVEISSEFRLPAIGDTSTSFVSGETVRRAISDFQSFAGLNPTGKKILLSLL